MNPKRFTKVCNAPESRWSLTRRSSLIMTRSPARSEGRELRRIVPLSVFRRVQEDSEDLRVAAGCPIPERKQGHEHDQTGEKAPEEVEGRGSDDQCKEEEPAVKTPDRQRAVDRSVDRVNERV